MNSDRIGPLLRRAYADASDCPSPETYLAESLHAVSAVERERLLRHAEECPRCGAELELARAFDDAPATAGPGTDAAGIVGRLERLGQERLVSRPLARSAWSWGLAAAAMLAITVVGIAVLDRDGAPPLPPPSGDLATRGARVELIAPVGDLDDLPATLEWEAVPDAASYRVRVLRVDDSILLDTTVETTRLDLPQETLNDLHRAVVYFWQVEALDGRGARMGVSDRARFRAAPE